MVKGEIRNPGGARMPALRRVIFQVARGAWPAVALAYSIALVIGTIQAYGHFFRQPCGYDVENCVNVNRWLAQTSIANEAPAMLYAATIALPGLVLGTLALVLFLKAGRTRSGLLFAYVLVAVWMSDITNISVTAMNYSFWHSTVFEEFWLPYRFTQGLYAFAMIAATTFTFLFPDGRSAPRWTRWLLLGWVGLTVLHEFASPASPLQYDNWHPVLNGLITFGIPLIGVAALTYRYQQVADAGQRQQIRWIVPSAVVVGLIYLASQAVSLSMRPKILYEDTLASFGAQTLINVSLAIGTILFGFSIAMSILRNRLFDIELILNRALVYGSLTAFVIGMYVIVVNGVNALLQLSNPLFGSLVATGLIAMVFQPIHRRLQRAVNRLMYGQRDDPYGIIAHLSRRLETAGAPGDVLQQIVDTVASSLKLPFAAIYFTGDAEPAASTGTPAKALARFTLVHQNEHVGELVLSPRSSESHFSSQEQEALADLARTAGIAAYAARSAMALRASREHLVVTREEERRRLHRDLHDGLGPTLAGVILSLDKARSLAANPSTDAADREQLMRLLGEIKQQTQSTMLDVRRLVYDLRPPSLDELGLVRAIREHASRAAGPLPISVEAPEQLPNLPAAVEVAAYRIVQEALSNVVQHAQAHHCLIHLDIVQKLPSTLLIEVADDGMGLPDAYKPGVGIESIRERAEEVGGSCQFVREPTGGTRMIARLPLPG